MNSQPVDEEKLAEQVAERAAEVEAEPVDVPEVETKRATAGGAYGTNRGLKKVKRGKITDHGKFAAALVAIKHKDLLELLQQLANRAAKAGMPVDGMEIEDAYE